MSVSFRYSKEDDIQSLETPIYLESKLDICTVYKTTVMVSLVVVINI